MTCFIQPQADYKDGIEPDSEFLEFYLKQFKEQSAEAGLSMEYKSADSLEEKVDRDGEFFANADSDYRYGAAFSEERDLTDVLNLSEIKLLKDVSTLICEYTEKHPVVSYASDSITLQSVVGDGMHYTYSADPSHAKHSKCTGVYEYHAESAGYFLAAERKRPLGDHGEAICEQSSDLLE